MIFLLILIKLIRDVQTHEAEEGLYEYIIKIFFNKKYWRTEKIGVRQTKR